MILLVSICKEKFHELEFVKPIEDILVKNKIKGFTRHYSSLTKKDLEKASKVIICGTSLKDLEYSRDIKKFNWIKNFNKPVLGICGGMQVIGLVFGGELKEKLELGFFNEKFKKSFLGLKEELEVYHLHNYFIDFLQLNFFKEFTSSKISQAVKHKTKPIYGCLFHPEVRNKKLILEFVKNG